MLFLRPNANSLHAAVSRPPKQSVHVQAATSRSRARGRRRSASLDPLDIPISASCPGNRALTMLVNAALNVRRLEGGPTGAAATPTSSCSAATMSAAEQRDTSKTHAMQASVRGLDLGSAMAVSGPALSSNMGAANNQAADCDPGAPQHPSWLPAEESQAPESAAARPGTGSSNLLFHRRNVRTSQ